MFISSFRPIGINLTEKPQVTFSALDAAITILYYKLSHSKNAEKVVEMTKSSNRLGVIDFVISILARHEKELDRSLARLRRLMAKLEANMKSEA